MNASSDYQKLRAHLAFLRMTAPPRRCPGPARAAAGPSLTSRVPGTQLAVGEARSRARRASLERFASPSPFTLADFDFSAQPSVDLS
jgi:hypothetical protein